MVRVLDDPPRPLEGLEITTAVAVAAFYSMFLSTENISQCLGVVIFPVIRSNLLDKYLLWVKLNNRLYHVLQLPVLVQVSYGKREQISQYVPYIEKTVLTCYFLSHFLLKLRCSSIGPGVSLHRRLCHRVL